MSARGNLATTRRRLMGLALLMSMVLFVSLTVAIYQKAFKPTVDVVLRATSTGNQLKPRSVVKVHGVVVGKVREVDSTGDGAELKLALEPHMVDVIPANVTARLLPKTLFGERYVSLREPRNPSEQHIASGDVITQDRTRVAIELQTVLADTISVLRAVQPADLAATLNSLDKALDGRGEQLGETLSQLNDYVQGISPAVGDLKRNLEELVGVARTYEKAAPDVLRALRNLTTTSRTLVEQQDDLATLTTQLTTTSGNVTEFLRANRDDLIRLGDSLRPTADVLAKYAPEYPCLLRNLANFVPRVNRMFGAGTDEPGLHVTLEVTPSRGRYVPGRDDPKYDDERGPRCYTPVQGRFPQYPPDGPVQDGSAPPPAPRSSGESTSPTASGPAATSTQSTTGGDLGMANSPAERDLVSAVVAPPMGVPAREVPGWGSMLVGPLLRGAEVSYR